MVAKKCDICQQRPARYVCQECGSNVCLQCFVPQEWMCVNCYDKFREKTFEDSTFSFAAPFKLFIAGFVITLVGMMLLIVSAFLSNKTSVFGGVWVFPFVPFIFGKGELNLLALILMVLIWIIPLLLFFYIFTRKIKIV